MDYNLHTLTAYRLVFSYMKRNNPLKQELEDEIKNNKVPAIDLIDLLNEFISNTNDSKFDVLKSGGKVILLRSIEDVEEIGHGIRRIRVRPSAGKTGEPINIVNLNDANKKYVFGIDWSSTYFNNIFFYEINGEYYCVCHRHGGSGCKTILCSVLNQILKSRGVKLEMNWLPPVSSDEKSKFDVDKITLICEEKRSSDIADEPTRKLKKVIRKELTLNLKLGFYGISGILNKYQLKEISGDTALEQIKSEVDGKDYNNASLLVRIGKARKKIAWDDFEGLIDGFDITDKVKNTGSNFIPVLKECSDEFILKLLEK